MKIHLRNNQRATRLNLPRIKKDLARVLHLLGCDAAELSVLFVNSRRMRALNAHYRGMPGPTDVLSFSMSEGDSLVPDNLLGDIVICVPKALSQSEEYGVPLYDELLRLLIHGLLHLLGYDHERGSYRKRKMERKERELLDALKAVA